MMKKGVSVRGRGGAGRRRKRRNEEKEEEEDEELVNRIMLNQMRIQ